MAFAIYGSLLPFDYQPLTWSEAVEQFRYLPFLELDIGHRADWVENILLFVPIGFFIAGSLTVDRAGRVRAVLRCIAVVSVSLLLSIALEFTQLWFPNRTASQNDIVAETMGACLGTGLWLACGQPTTDWLRCLSVPRRPAQRFTKILQAYCLGLLGYSLMPLDFTISAAEVWHKFQDGRLQPIPFTTVGSWSEFAYDLVSNSALFAPMGVLIAGLPSHERHGVRSWWQCVLGGLLVTSAIEICQIFIYSRFADTTDILTGTMGVCLGVAAVRYWYRSETAAPFPQIPPTVNSHASAGAFAWVVLYSVFLVALFWAPYHVVNDHELVRERWQHFFRTPFYALYLGNGLNWATQISRKCLLFAILGALLLHWCNRSCLPSGLRRSLLLLLALGGSMLGFFIELGQLWLTQSTPDFTDVLLYAFGIVFGMLVAHYVLKGPHQVGLLAGPTSEPTVIGLARAPATRRDARHQV